LSVPAACTYLLHFDLENPEEPRRLVSPKPKTGQWREGPDEKAAADKAVLLVTIFFLSPWRVWLRELAILQ